MVAPSRGEGSQRGPPRCGHSGVPRPPAPAPRGLQRRERCAGLPCWGARGGKLRGAGQLASPGPPGRARLERAVTEARAAARRSTHTCLWMEKQSLNTWVGTRPRLCQQGAVRGAASAGRPAARGPALRPGPTSRRRPAPFRCLPGCLSSLELPLLPALPGNLQRWCRVGRTKFVCCSHEVKIARALGGRETVWQIQG